MKINIFIGIEGTHKLVDDMVGGSIVAAPNNTKVLEQFALNNILLVTGPVLKYPFENSNSMETILHNMFGIDDTKQVCNIGFFGFSNTAAEVINRAPVGSRLWFFRPTDTLVTAECLIEMSTNCWQVGNYRIIGEYGEAVTSVEQSTHHVNRRMAMLEEQAKTTLSSLYLVNGWQPFNADLFNGGDSPPTSSIEAMCWEITS
jgi:hypothetical protein